SRVLAVVDDAQGLNPDDWPALPAAAPEGRRVVSLYPEGVLLEGAAATPAALIEGLAHADVLHVAAHAATGEHAGLLLHASSRDDGPLLRVDTLAGLRSVARMRVAVLASCRTAAGAESLEGPLSLARGFLAAGTPAVVASLWDLPDAASAELVPALHRGLASGTAPAAARRQPHLDALRSGGPAAQPRGWAALELVIGLDNRPRQETVASVRLTQKPPEGHRMRGDRSR